MSREVESIDKRFAYYYAEIKPEQEINLELAEGIGSYVMLSPSEFEGWVCVGKITDANTIKAYFLALIQKLIFSNS